VHSQNRRPISSFEIGDPMVAPTASIVPLVLFIASGNALRDQGAGSSHSAVTFLRGEASASALEDKAAEARKKYVVPGFALLCMAVHVPCGRWSKPSHRP
jgi:hypothetical protein